jgi:glyceraldehyde 3-phosphate dehydrogenase
LTEGSNFESKQAFLDVKIGKLTSADGHVEPRDVVLYGFGRIGRLAARELIKQAGKGQQLRLRAIVTRGSSDSDIIKRASLLRNDSVHGAFKGSVIEDLENKALIINGQIVKMIDASNPEDIDYTQYGINNALIIDNTGVFTNREALSRHLKAKGVGKVLLTAPGKEIPNVVYGINQGTLDIENENIFSAASCTTNAISPVLKVINDKYGVVKGHIETVHAYTNDQNTQDAPHPKNDLRRARAAAQNIVPNSTGAAKAIGLVLPSLKGKLDGTAQRVPTLTGSLTELTVMLAKKTTTEEINAAMKAAANESYGYTEDEIVSGDVVGIRFGSLFDATQTKVQTVGDHQMVRTVSWYDNEMSYVSQLVRTVHYFAQLISK